MVIQRLKTAWRQASKDQIPLLAAGVAFYGFLSLFPALIAGVLLYGLIASPDAVTEQSAKLADALPADAASLIAGQMTSITATTSGSLGFGLILAVLVALWSASGGVGNLIAALNTAFGCAESRGFIQRKVLALKLTLAGIFFVMILVTLVAVAPIVFDAIEIVPGLRLLLEPVRWVVLLGAVLGTISVLYRVAPNRERAAITRTGVVAATGIFLTAALGFSLYVDNFGSYGKTYGALAGVVALLLWLWVSAYAILFGAELEKVLAAELPDEPAADEPAADEPELGEPEPDAPAPAEQAAER